MRQLLIGYIPCKDAAEGKKIARALLEDRLIACGNIIEKISSIYRGKGEIKEEAESLLLIKTQTGRQDKIIEKVNALHSYNIPCIEFIPVQECNKAYAGWLEENLKK